MFELLDMFFRFVVVPILLFLAVVTVGAVAHEFFTGAYKPYNVTDVLGQEEDDGLGDVDDDDEETVRI